MNIAILGYGKIGREIEKTAVERNHNVALIIDIENQADLNQKNLSGVDVAIDFTVPDSAYSNILKCFEHNIPVVSGTTGWLDKLEEIISVCKEKSQAFFYAPNYSPGVNIFMYLNRYLAEIMNRFPDYEITIEETHHKQKLDAPSGTAIKLANDIIPAVGRKSKWEPDNTSDKSSIKITSIRKEDVMGVHKITYDSPMDIIEIQHSAKSRKGFALGAVLAAEFIKGKKGYYTLNDLLQIDK